MAKHKDKNQTDKEDIKNQTNVEETQAAEDSKSEAENGLNDAGVSPEKLAAALEKALGELAEQKERHIRLAAEYDNFRKRSQKERDGVYADAYCAAVLSFLPVIDNLGLATQHTDGGEKLKQGLDLIMKQVADTFSKLDIEEIPALGEKFDPNLHNAVMHVEDESAGDNTIVEVYLKGYRLGDRVIRHAMVKSAN